MNAGAATSRGVTYFDPPTGSVLQVPPDQLREVIRGFRRVRPDRRFVLAVADLHDMLTSSPRQPLYARWVDGGWAIEYGNAHTPVGTLPELASLGAARELLARWALALAKERPMTAAPSGEPAVAAIVRNAIDSLSAPPLVEALSRIDKEWRRSRDPRLLPLAAEALTLLATFADDRTDMADALFSRALAATVAARALAGAPARRADALLAYELGYGSEAHDSANALAADDPIRGFLDHNDSALMKLADGSNADPVTRYLAIRRAASNGRAAWDSALTRIGRWPAANTAAIETGFSSRGFDFQGELPRVFAFTTLLELDRVAPSPRLTDRVFGSVQRRLFGNLIGGPVSLGSPKEVSALAERLGRTRDRYRGPFVDSAVIDGYYRSAYFAAVAGAANFDLEMLSSVSASQDLARRMKGEHTDAAGREYANWVDRLADVKAGRGSKQSLDSALAASHSLGQEQLALLFDAFARGALFNQHLDVLDAARGYTAHLDSRPKHLSAIAGLTYAHMWDMPNAERLYRRLVELDRDNANAPWVARLARDTTRLRAMLESPATPHATRREVARLVGLDSLAPDAYVRSWFERLIAAQPADWPTRDDYLEVLDKRQDAVTAERVATEWLDKWEDAARNSFEPVNARVWLSRALERQKRYADAWTAIEPAIPAYTSAAMTQGARVLGKLGRLDDAHSLATDEAERYPDSPYPYVGVAEVLWRQRRYADAARYLHDHQQWLDAWTWRGRIAERFLDVFGDAPDGETTTAIRYLGSANIPGWVLGQFGIGLRQRKRADLAFALHQLAQEPTGAGGQQLPMQAFTSLRAWRGEAAAVSWLRQFTSGVEGPTAMILYQDDAFEELWSLDPPGRSYSPFTWLMRAAAAAQSPAVARRHRDELVAYYTRPIPDDYHMMGRYIMGLVSEADLLARATTAKRRCEIAYYIGVRARAEGRPYDAADWFAVAIETRQLREGELIWAARQLSEWANQGKTLAVLEARR